MSAKPLFKDRDEEEVRGYREALEMIHDKWGNSTFRKKKSAVLTA